MSPSSQPTAPVPVPVDIITIEQSLTHIAYLTNRVRQHERLMALAGVPLDRAAVALLRAVADSDALRPSELAGRLGVEASHITRQVQQLQKAGYVTRVPDPDDRRAQHIRLTPTGQDAVDRVRQASRRGMQLALGDWTPEELHQLATLFRRMVDDFLSGAGEDFLNGTGGHAGAADPR
ncbi:MarR family winged helix-turn-helix transcriptional regulator [Streptomyces corynorhini]|uniref:MarR family transcriptional regulator n=1 Tax=Streptomyces corynorhini TaxID=2282652 RepID=A0A370BFF9_9ACTN|nr:MarR family transcriptional regulator [Streptomyces corynorhini]RDG38994.1 MarR family transcriptional regulator [Streptomyces corynorhini]